MRIGAKQKVVMIGDSITDAGREKGTGTAPSEGLFDPLGRGYVTMVEALLGVTYPDRGIRVVNVGTSGHTVRDLDARWERDVIDLKPDWVSCMIGTNDVWRQFDLPRMTESHVLPDVYEQTYRRLLERTLPLVKGIVLLAPFYVEPNRADPMRARMDEYGRIVRRLAEQYGAVFVDTQAAFDRVLGHVHPNALAWDRVHPNQTGHMVIANALLNALGYEWPRDRAV
ncbi:MAG TPA: SGNH/GDSL hydrolase family protein [Tepidisphaeraceae bacterium]|nr:SGNH/GDSL hydrolase family protein [Tepidisphaeraceae bacterium]